MKSGEICMEMKALHRHGWTVSQLAREFGISRTTVYQVLASAEPRRDPERAKPTAPSEAQVIHLERRLRACPQIRGRSLYQELCTRYGYEGSYPAFQRHLRRLRPELTKEPVIRFETNTGWQTQVDWAGCGRWPVGGSWSSCRPWWPSWATAEHRRFGSPSSAPGPPPCRGWSPAWTIWAG